MKYQREDLENMSNEDLIKVYRGAKTSLKKEILTNLANSRKFAILMENMYLGELEQMAKIHPYKEVILDAMIDEMESHGTQFKFYEGEHFEKERFNKFLNSLQYKGLLTRIKETLTRKPALSETLSKKIEQTKKLCEIEVKRNSATGKKLENLETKGLDQSVNESRVEVNNGEMAKIFDRYAKKAREEGAFFGTYGKETQVAQKLKTQLKEEYMSMLGSEHEDVAQLIANSEFENYSGKDIYVPYNGNFRAKNYYSDYNQSISGETDNRGWKKNLLEIEQVQDFTAGKHVFGEVFIVKSEFNPTSYAIKGKWAPVYEYYTKNENGEMIRIGSGKINSKTGKMETTISIDGQDRSDDIRYGTEELTKAKEDGTVIQFDSSEYTGKRTKISRKDIEQVITTKEIQEYLGKEKHIADITQLKDIPAVTYDENGDPQTKNAYMVASLDNGVETYEMVCVGEDGKCEKYPGMNKETLLKKEIYFPTGMSTGYNKQTSLNLLEKKQALETFRSKDGVQYSAYRDEGGKLRIAQMVEHFNGGGIYAEELDTYSVVHEDIERIKEQSEEEQNKELTLLIEEHEEKTTELNEKNKEDDILSL